MQPDFWLERWRLGQIAFHQPAVDRRLEQHWPGLAPRGGRVFVPLCGKSLDLLWLRERGHSVSGVELSAVALESFCMENGIPARRRILGAFDVYETEHLALFCGDFFALTPQLLGSVSAIYDRAALISWSPELRAAYAAHLASLTAPGARMLLICLEYPQAQMAGPPFSVSREDVDELYGPQFLIRELSRYDILDAEPKLRARGLGELQEVCYALTRL